MMRPVRLALAALLLIPASAAAQQPTTPVPTPPPAPAPAPAPTPPPAPAPAPVAGVLRINATPVTFAGQRIEVKGHLTPVVKGQQVVVRFYRHGHKLRAVAVEPGRDGRFRLRYSTTTTGSIVVRAVHRATKAMRTAVAKPRRVKVLRPSVGPGAHGDSVRWLQRHLARLHYAVPRSGTYDDGTARAVTALRKMTSLDRDGGADEAVFSKLLHGAGAFKVRYRSHGRHVEGDLTHQVLALIEPGGKVHRLYTMSSGKPSTPTVLGHFKVYLKTPGTNSEGMVDSNYFIRGYAIHGYAEVPTYNASHGCLRVPIPDAGAIYAWVHIGTPVDVYYR